MTHPEHDDVINVRLLFVALQKARGGKEEDRKKEKRDRDIEKERKRCGNTSHKRLIGANAYIEKREEGGGENDGRQEILERSTSFEYYSWYSRTGTRGERDERDEGGHGESKGRVHMSRTILSIRHC